MLAFSFYDGLKSQFEAAGTLDAEGIPATFFVPAGLLDATEEHMTRDAVAALADSGHEIGSHGLSHMNLLSLGTTDPYDAFRIETDREQLTYQIAGSQRILQTITGQPVIGIAPPYGRMGWDSLIASTYGYARSTKKHPITSHDNVYNLGSFSIKDATTEQEIDMMLATAATPDHLVILNFHDVAAESSEPRYALNPLRFAEIITRVKDAELNTVTIRHGLEYLGLV